MKIKQARTNNWRVCQDCHVEDGEMEVCKEIAALDESKFEG